MSQTTPSVLNVIPRGVWSSHMKTLATIASTVAAVASIVGFLMSWGMIGNSESRQTVGSIGARWVGLRPAADTAAAIGDTLHLAATITDKNGTVLVGTHPVWTSANPDVAAVEPDGSVIARAPGTTTIIAVVGTLSAHSRIVVRQVVNAVHIAGDSAITLLEGDHRPLAVTVSDVREHAVNGRRATWSVDDSSVVNIDSAGQVTARDAGHAIITTTVDNVSAHALITVTPMPTTIASTKGDGQHAHAGTTLPLPVVVRVTNHRGKPVAGTLVRFRAGTEGGSSDAAAVVTDADGRAHTSWTLADVPGRQHLLAMVEHIDSALVISAEADPVAANTRVASLVDSLTGMVGKPVVSVVGIRVTDSLGRPLVDVPVTWRVVSGGAVAAVAERTDSLGEARAHWTLGNSAGVQRLRAQVGGGRSVAPFTLSAVASQPEVPPVVAPAHPARKAAPVTHKPGRRPARH